MTPIIYTRHSLHGCQFITHNIFSSWPLSHLLGCVYIEGNVPLFEVSVSSPRRQRLWYFQEKYAAGATARDSCPCAWHESQSVCASLRLSLSPHTSAVISQTMAIYDKVPLRAICQENLWEGGRRDGWGEWQGNDGWCADSSRKKGTMCAQNEQARGRLGVSVCLFSARQRQSASNGKGVAHTHCLSEPWHYKGAKVSQDVTTSHDILQWHPHPTGRLAGWTLTLARAHPISLPAPLLGACTSCTATAEHPPTPFSVSRSATPTRFPLRHHVCRQKMGRGTRLMMVLPAYLSSNWRVMQHLSNLNIFHWAVMVLSPRPAA